jgi:hypothetical protein
MRSAYRILAYLMALEVIVQAGAIAYALSGLGAWIQSGGVLDKAAMESETTEFPGVVGFMVHGINGQMIIPLIALLLLVVSFFARIRGGVGLAAMVCGGVAVQVLLGIFARGGIPVLGLVHGMLAIVIFAAAMAAARRAAVDAVTGIDSDRRVAGVG